MATYYAGPRFWDLQEVQEVTVRANSNISRRTWVEQMVAWAEERGIAIRWTGESTHTQGSNSWHEAHFLIAGEDNRFMFMLAWNG